MKQLTIINLAAFTGLVIAYVMVVSVTCAAPTPTPIQPSDDKEKRMAERRVALSYICGYSEGKYGGVVEQVCDEYRILAERHGMPKRKP